MRLVFSILLASTQLLHPGHSQSPPSQNVVAYVYEEARLVTDLLAAHKRITVVRPARDAASSVVVTLSLALVGIVDINEKDGYMTTAIFPKMSWNDPRLSWIRSHYSDIQQIELPASDIWVPDIEVYNRYGDAAADNAMHSLAWVTYDGNVTYTPRRHIQTPCQFNLLNFPYDKHECEIIMGSWSYDVSKVNIVCGPTSDSSLVIYEGTRDWDLLSFEVDQSEVASEDGMKFASVVGRLAISRRPSYFYRLYVGPPAVMMFAIPLVHFIPAGSSEKLTLCGSMLVTTTIMFTMLEELFPAYSVGQVPVLLHYYSSVLLLLFLSMFLACTSGVVAHPGTKASRVPSLLKKYFLDRMGFMCCVTGRVNRFNYDLLHLEQRLMNRLRGVDDGERQMSQLEGQNIVRSRDDSNEPLRRSGSLDEAAASSEASPLPPSAAFSHDQTIKVMQAIVSEMQYTRYVEACRVEWQQLATLIDRLAGFLFFILAILLTVAIIDASL